MQLKKEALFEICAAPDCIQNGIREIGGMFQFPRALFFIVPELYCAIGLVIYKIISEAGGLSFWALSMMLNSDGGPLLLHSLQNYVTDVGTKDGRLQAALA